MWHESDSAATIYNDWLKNVYFWIYWLIFIEILVFVNPFLKTDKLLCVLSSLCESGILSVMQAHLDDFFQIFIAFLYSIFFQLFQED